MMHECATYCFFYSSNIYTTPFLSELCVSFAFKPTPPRRQGRFLLVNSLFMARASTLVTGYRWASGPVGLQIRFYSKARVVNPRQQVVIVI